MSDKKPLITPEMEAHVNAFQRRGAALIVTTILVVAVATSVAEIPLPLLVAVAGLFGWRVGLQVASALGVALVKGAERAGYGEDK